MLAKPQPSNSLAQQIAAQAELIVNTLKETHYTHDQYVNADKGVYDCDCSEFVGLVLEQIAPDHYTLIPFDHVHPRPLAFEYYEFFASLNLTASAGRWNQVQALQDARRGDIIAWQLPNSTGDTGHVFFVAETPALTPSGTFSVRLYDSANVPHYEESRANGTVVSSSGVGTGFINFKVGEAGQPSAFQFAPTEPHGVTLPMAIGRVGQAPADTYYFKP